MNKALDWVFRIHYTTYMSQAATIFKKLATMEQEIQKMKVRAYFNLPKRDRPVSIYSEDAIRRAVETTRNQIWRRGYAKKIKGVS